MATQGLSLLGFLDEAEGIAHLRSKCIPSDSSNDALAAEWRIARMGLGSPVTGAGHPAIDAIPSSHHQYVQRLRRAAWLQPNLSGPWSGARFCMIEIDKLLAFSILIDTQRSGHYGAAMSRPPLLSEMLETCLPQQPTGERMDMWDGANKQSMLIKARSLNVSIVERGAFTDNRVGIAVGVTLPLLHVVVSNDRHYLHNGYHRAYAMRQAGATYAPFILREVADDAAIGIRSDGSTFSAALLESENPPTLAHFTQGRAHPVIVRSISRIIHV